MATRTDRHSLKNLNPEEYQEVGEFYQGSSQEMHDIYNTWFVQWGKSPWDEHEENPFDGNFTNKGTCDHCGRAFAYGLFFRHVPTGEVIAVGNRCAQKMYLTKDDVDYMFNRRNELMKECRALKRVQTFLAENPGLEEALKYKHHILFDMERKLRRYGKLSEKQVAFALRLPDEDRARKAKWAAMQPADDCLAPQGDKIEVTGTIVKSAWQENGFGGRAVMLIRLDDNNRIWGTQPSKIADYDCNSIKGVRVTFVANFQRSRDDDHFSFYKRPHKFKIIFDPNEQEESDER